MKYLNKLNPSLSRYKVFPCGASKDTIATNEANERIAREANETNLAMNRENNETQIRLQQEMNEYNSIFEQIERAKRAGVNPNAVISGQLSGNLQSTLPTTQAGHVDPWRVENPYMERLGTIEQMRGSVNDFFQNMNTSASTEYTKSQAQAQEITNHYLDDMQKLGLQLGSAQVNKLKKEVDVLGDQQQLMYKQGAEIDTKIKNMAEQTRSLFLDNYFKESANKGFIEYCRKQYDDMGIPRKKQLSDDALIAIRYGAITQFDVPLSQLQTEKVKRAEMNSSIGVNNAMRNLTNAKTKAQYIENAYNEMFGWTERVAGIDNLDSQTNLNNANAKKQKQNYNIDNWQTSEQVQTQRAYSVALGNLQTEANIDNTKVDTGKKVAETAHEVQETASGLINTFTPWAK